MQLPTISIVDTDIYAQFSLFDARPLSMMVETCQKYGMKLLTYGSFVIHASLPKAIKRLIKVDSAGACFLANGLISRFQKYMLQISR